MKECPHCKVFKSDEEFVRFRRNKPVPQQICRDCRILEKRARRENQPLGKSHYHSYIQSDKWGHKKEKFRKSGLNNKGQCAVCFNRIETHIHHLTYERLGVEYLSDLKRLCFVCHVAAHERHDGNSIRVPTKGMKSQWSSYAKRHDVWKLQFSDPVIYALHVAKCFGVSDHPRVQDCIVRILGEPLRLA